MTGNVDMLTKLDSKCKYKHQLATYMYMAWQARSGWDIFITTLYLSRATPLALPMHFLGCLVRYLVLTTCTYHSLQHFIIPLEVWTLGPIFPPSAVIAIHQITQVTPSILVFNL